jgi:hypothetical protein
LLCESRRDTDETLLGNADIDEAVWEAVGEGFDCSEAKVRGQKDNPRVFSREFTKPSHKVLPHEFSTSASARSN